MSNEIFLTNIDEYNQYKQNHHNCSRKVKFICNNCGKLAEKQFKSLKIPFLCRSCTCKIAQANPESKLRRANTNLARYGTTCYLTTDEGKEKTKSALLEIYGYDNAAKAPEVKEQIKNTNLMNYGVTSYTKTNECKQKIKKTKLERYGNENYTNIDAVQKTNLEKYGVTSYSKTKEFIIKTKTTNLKKYGKEYYSQTDEYK